MRFCVARCDVCAEKLMKMLLYTSLMPLAAWAASELMPLRMRSRTSTDLPVPVLPASSTGMPCVMHVSTT